MSQLAVYRSSRTTTTLVYIVKPLAGQTPAEVAAPTRTDPESRPKKAPGESTATLREDRSGMDVQEMLLDVIVSAANVDEE